MDSSKKIVIEITGPPSAGKTTVKENLCQRLHEQGIRVGRITADGQLYQSHKKLLWEAARHKTDDEIKRLINQQSSLTFLSILVNLEIRIRNSMDEIILLEQGPVFMSIIESFGSEVPQSVLDYVLRDVRMPDKVFYLDTPVKDCRERCTGHRTRDLPFMEKVYAGFLCEYRHHKQDWVRIDGAQPKAMVAEDVWIHLWNFLEPKLNRDRDRQGGKKNRQGSGNAAG
jgi:thymidylate kinase